jgi:hypothetical protein
MNKKTIAIIATALALFMSLTPFAFAKSTDYPKNNEKFQSFSVSLIPVPVNSVADYEIKYIPNEENAKVTVQTWGNNIVTTEIVIGGAKLYVMGVDFEYSQSCKYIATGSPFFTVPGYGLVMGTKSHLFVINYVYDFSAVPDGIDGTLEMRFVSSMGTTSITSLRGTGDLQNVQIKATASGTGHTGVVIGWPE